MEHVVGKDRACLSLVKSILVSLKRMNIMAREYTDGPMENGEKVSGLMVRE